MLYIIVSNYSAGAGIYEITYHTAWNTGNFKTYVSKYLQESGKKNHTKKVTVIGLKIMPSTHIKITQKEHQSMLLINLQCNKVHPEVHTLPHSDLPS